MRKSAVLLLILAILVVAGTASVQSATASENSWITRPSMPEAEESLRSAVVNGKIYALGVDGTNQEYDPLALTWTKKASMPNPMYGFSTAVHQNKIYVIGQSYIEVYDVATDTWTSKTSMPTWRIHLQANVVNDKIYLIGGISDAESGTVSTLNEVYDPATDRWTTKEPLPNPVSHHASAVVDNKIYIMGGSGEPPNIMNGQVQVYDPETDSWTFGKPMPTPLRMASAGATTGKFAPKQIYVIGGLQSGNGLSLNQVYDPQSDNWTLGTSMPTARYGLAVAVVNDTLYAMGGVLLPPYAFPKVPLDANEVYLPLGYEGPMPPYWASPPSPSPSTNRLITISASGSVEGTDQIRRDGDTYVFKSSITGSIVVERENVVVDGAGYTLQGTGSGKGIELADRSNVTIQHVEIEEFDDGIWLFNASNNIITGNTITANNQWGIRLAGSSNNTVSGNNITNNDYGGIVFTDSNNNIISGNNITDSFVGLDFSASENNIVSGNYIENNDDGIHLENMHNSIIGNTITNNGDKGIFLYGAGSNNIIGNNITNNVYGIFVSICWNNPTYHNNFANNAVHIYTDESSGIWDDGKEGNYWDNYTGFDNNGDGIGDTPYLIDENNQDNYPLMNQWIPPTQQPEPFPTTWIIAATAIITIGAVAFLVFFRRIKKTPGEVEKITPEA